VTLREKIVREIREYGPIPFSRYMEMCLYDPELGYYSRNVERFGKAGDFYTSSDVHAVFGRLLARQFEEMWRVLGSPSEIEILELGPGRGLFAQDVMDWSEKKFSQLFAALHYSLTEQSAALREKLKTNLARHFSRGKVRFADLPSADVPVIVFGNEFFDALPVEVTSSQGELRIAEKDGRFVETWVPASAEELEFVDRYGIFPEEGERVETPLAAQSYMRQVAGSVNQGFVIAIDYGYTRGELLAGRHRGTVMAYRQHSVSESPYDAPGEQDITAHVNFTALAAGAEQEGMLVQPLVTQSQFLLGIGEQNQFADAFEECRLPQERAKVALQLKHLITPAGMGETFHVLVASKGVDAERLANLKSLSFGKARSPTKF
jgi:SAM-dependent MidA family methyltransferase